MLMKITLIGGDGRTLALARRLKMQGASLSCLGLPPGAPNEAPDLFSALEGSEAIILPLPATRDGIHPTSEGEREMPQLSEIFSRAPEECLLLGGMLSPALLALAEAEGLEAVDYYKSERLLEKNAALTAEAAVGMAIFDLPISLSAATVCVIGAGRIAAALVRLLRAFSARVLVYARREEARAEARTWGAEALPIPTGTPLSLPRATRAVFSTVPARLFDRAAVEELPRGIPFYDLGGGGIDAEAAKARGILLPGAAGLPGRFFPETAGAYLFDEIRAILFEKRGVSF